MHTSIARTFIPHAYTHNTLTKTIILHAHIRTHSLRQSYTLRHAHRTPADMHNALPLHSRCMERLAHTFLSAAARRTRRTIWCKVQLIFSEFAVSTSYNSLVQCMTM